MVVLWIIVPLCVVAVAIAVVPVLVGSVRHERSIREGDTATTTLAAREANAWHARLGRRTRRVPRQLEPGSGATVADGRRGPGRGDGPSSVAD